MTIHFKNKRSGLLIKIMSLVYISLSILSLSAMISVNTYAQRPEGYLVTSLRTDLSTMNPFMTAYVEESQILDLVYDKLFRRALNGSMVPWLAYKVEVEENGTLWKFYIRDGVKWHDGVPLTAEDVEYTFNLTVAYKFPRRANIWQAIDKVWRDGNVVYVKLKYPYAYFSDALDSLWIIPKHIWSKISDPMTFSNFDNPIGSGPFIWVERRAGDYVSLKANENYWAGAPKIKGVVFKLYGTADAAYQATLKGEIDSMNILFVPPHLIPKAVEEVSRNPALKIHMREPLYFQYMTYSVKRYPFSLREFREAMLYAINVTEIVDVVYGGYAKPGSLGTYAPVLAEMPGNFYRPGLEKEKLYPFNLSRAREILDQLGFKPGSDGVRVSPNGTRLEFDLLVSSIYPDRVRIAEMIRDWFSEIGIKLNVKVLEHRTVGSTLLSHNFDLVIIGIWMSDADGWFNLLHSSAAVKGGFNTADYVNPEVDKLLEEQRQTIDLDKRREILWKIQEIVARDIPYVPLVHIYEAYVYRVDRFDGWQLSKIVMPVNFWTMMSLQLVSQKTQTTQTPQATTLATQTQSQSVLSTPTSQATTQSLQSLSQTTSATPQPGGSDAYVYMVAVIVIVLIAGLGAYVFMKRRR